jgi:SET domain-containing protein
MLCLQKNKRQHTTQLLDTMTKSLLPSSTLCLLLCSLTTVTSLVGQAQNSFSLRSAEVAGIDIKNTKAMGLGGFASVPIPFGTMLGEFSGELITDYEVKTRYRGKHDILESDRQWAASRDERSQTQTGSYLFEMGDGMLVDGEDTDLSGWCRYMNHAKEGTIECNVRPFDHETEIAGLHKPRFFATRDIKAGEELKYNYGEIYWNEKE